MVLIPTEAGWWIYWTKDVKDEADRQKVKKKTTERFMNVVKEDI